MRRNAVTTQNILAHSGGLFIARINLLRFFNDGILIGTAAFNVVIRQASEAVRIGSLNLASYGYFFPGYIWEVRISNVARSTSNYPLVTTFPDA